MSRADPQMNLRVPVSLREYVAQQAKANHRSQTAEIIHRLEQTKMWDEQQREQASA
jgi:hypothetical protein